MESKHLEKYYETPTKPWLLRRSVNFTSKKIYQALSQDIFVTQYITHNLANAYKEMYKFKKYNPEILASADESDGASFRKFARTRTLDMLPLIAQIKQPLERGLGKQFLSQRAIPRLSPQWAAHLLWPIVAGGSRWYWYQSGVDMYDRDFSNPQYVYAFALRWTAKLGYYSLYEELHNEYSSNWRKAQQRHHQRQKAGLPRDPSFRTRSKWLSKEWVQHLQNRFQKWRKNEV